MANMYKMHILGLICMWDAYSTLMCTVSWSYMHPHTPSYYKKKQKQWAAGRYEHACALYRCPSVCQYAWAGYGDRSLRVVRGFSVDMYRILVIHALTRAMWHVDYVHRIQDRVLMDGCSMDAPCISVLVFASMYGVHILGLICMWDAYSTLMCTVSWSYKRHHASCS